MLADDGGVGGEAWTCDGQTNGKKFIQLVCPSTLLLVGMVADDGGVGGWPAVKHGNGMDLCSMVL